MKFYPPFPHGIESPVPLWVFHWVWDAMHFLYSYCGRNVFSISLCHWTLMFRSRKPGDSDYYERERDVSFAGVWGEEGCFASDFTECWCWREKRRKEGRGVKSEQEVGDICPCLRLRGAKLPTYHLFSTLQPEPKQHQFVSRSFGLNLIINKWCLGSGFTQTLAAEVPSSGGYKSIFSIYFERLSFLPRVKFIVGSKTNIPAPDLFPRHAVRVWRLDCSTSQVRGRGAG